MVGIDGHHQQHAIAVGSADQAVFQPHRHTGHTVGGHHGKRVVDAPRRKRLPTHHHQPAGGIGIGKTAVAKHIHPRGHTAITAQEVDFGLPTFFTVTEAGACAPAHTALARHGALHVGSERGALVIALHAGAHMGAPVKRPAETHKQVALAAFVQVLVEADVKRGGTAQGLEPVGAGQTCGFFTRRPQIQIAQAKVACVLRAITHKGTAGADGRRTAVTRRHVTVVAMGAGTVRTQVKTSPLPAVAQVELRATAVAVVAVGQRTRHQPQGAELPGTTDTGFGQPFGGFTLGFESEIVRHAVTPHRSGGGIVAVVEGAQAVTLPHHTQVHRPVGQTRGQQLAGVEQ